MRASYWAIVFFYLVFFLLLVTLLLHDLLVKFVHFLLMLSSQLFHFSWIIILLTSKDFLFVLDSCLRLLVFKLLDFLRPSVFQEISHNTFDVLTLILQSFQELLLFLNWVSFAHFFHVLFILSSFISFIIWSLFILYNKKGIFLGGKDIFEFCRQL
jgi:hypothetical protein